MKERPAYKEDVSLREVIIKLREWSVHILRQWKLVLLAAIAGAAVGLGYAMFKKPYYTAVVTFVTETNNAAPAALGAYAGIAAQLGLGSEGNNLGGGLFDGDNIFDLMKSRRMLMKTLLTPVTIDGKKMLLIDRYIAMKKLRDRWKKNPALRNISFDKDTARFTINHYAIIQNICGAIVAGNLHFDKGSVFSVSCRSQDELFSKLFIEKLISNVSAFYIDTRTAKARENLAIIQKQLDSVRTQLYGAMSSVASFEDINQNLIRQEPRVQQQKGSLKVQVNAAIYQQLVTSLEAAKVTLRKETPLFEVIDYPMLPLERTQTSKIKWLVAGAFLGAFFAIAWLLLRKIFREIMTDDK